MLFFDPAPVLAMLALALLLDALLGEPAWLYRRVPHPVVALGRLIGGLEVRLWREDDGPARRVVAGALLWLLVMALAGLAGVALAALFGTSPAGVLLQALLASTLIAQKSLDEHVRAVADGLDRGLDEGRAAVARIVGRDPDRLDGAGVARAAVESTAENFADGVVAPVLWGLLLGLPGVVLCKAANTLDSMLGYRDARYSHFGRIAARADDLLNLVPARVTALLLALATGSRARAGRALATAWRDSGHHRSPNAGWPEAALAGGLDFRLAGPRAYAHGLVEDAWIGNGRSPVDGADIRLALAIAWRAWALGLVLLIVAAVGAVLL